MDKLTGTVPISSLPEVSEFINIKVSMPGINKSDGNNAVQVPLDKILNYLQENSEKSEKVTCNELKSKISSNSLIPGMTYELVDYKSFMKVPGVKADSTDYLHNVGLLRFNYIQITPQIVALSSNKLSNVGKLLEFPDIEIGFLFGLSVNDYINYDPYYNPSRFPAEAFSYGIITYMWDKRRNIKCEFDFINSIVLTGGEGICNKVLVDDYAQTELQVLSYSAHRFFPYQAGIKAYNNGGDWDPTNTYKAATPEEIVIDHKGSVLLFNSYFLNNPKFTRFLSEMNGKYVSTNGGYVKSKSIDLKCNLPALGGGAYSDSSMLVAYLWRDAFFNDSMRPNKVYNIFVGRSPINTSYSFFSMSNVASVIMGQSSKGTLIAPNHLSWSSSSSYNRDETNNIKIVDSDFIKVGICIGKLEFDKSFGISINGAFGNNSFSNCYFTRFDTIKDSELYSVCYCSLEEVTGSKFNKVVNSRIRLIEDSTLDVCSNIISMSEYSCIINSRLSNVFNCLAPLVGSDRTLDKTEGESTTKYSLTNYYGTGSNFISSVIDCEISMCDGLNNNGVTMLPLGSIAYKSCKFTGFASLIFCMANNCGTYNFSYVKNTIMTFSSDGINSTSTYPSNNYSFPQADPIFVENFEFSGSGSKFFMSWHYMGGYYTANYGTDNRLYNSSMRLVHKIGNYLGNINCSGNIGNFNTYINFPSQASITSVGHLVFGGF